MASFGGGAQTYKRRSRKERSEIVQKREQEELQKKLKSLDAKASEKRRLDRIKHNNISHQLLQREMNGIPSSVKSNKPYQYSPIDSLLVFYQKKLSGTALSRLSVLTKGNKQIENKLLEGNLCLLGYPDGNDKYPLTMLGFSFFEHDSDGPRSDSWGGSIWKKSIDLYFMNIHYKDISYRTKSSNSTIIPRSNSLSEKRNTKENVVNRTTSLTNSKIITQSKPIALLSPIATVRCCTIGIDVHSLCVHQSKDKKIFFLYSGQKEKKQVKKTIVKQRERGCLPNSHAARLTKVNEIEQDNGDIDFSHYEKDSIDILTSCMEEESQQEIDDGYLCIIPSPLEYDESVLPCAALHISFPGSIHYQVFDPKQCIYTQEGISFVLNLRHALYRVSITYNSEEHYIPEDIDSKNHSVNISYYPDTNHASTFIHTRSIDSFDIDRYLYDLIDLYFPQLSRALLHLSTIVLDKISESKLLIQLLFYSEMSRNVDSKQEKEHMRGGFLFSFDILTGERELVHTIEPNVFTKVEKLHEWANRMAEQTKSMSRRTHKSYNPDYTWDNSAYQNSTPIKLLPHPTYPFILVNDLLHNKI